MPGPLHNIIINGVVSVRDVSNGSYFEPMLARVLLDRVAENLAPKWVCEKIYADKMTLELRTEVYRALLQQIETRGLMNKMEARNFSDSVNLRLERNTATIEVSDSWCKAIDAVFLAGPCPRCKFVIPVPRMHEPLACDEQICQDVLEA